VNTLGSSRKQRRAPLHTSPFTVNLRRKTMATVIAGGSGHSRPIGRATNLNSIDKRAEYSYSDNFRALQIERQRREQLDAFARAVRGKENWALKICDARNLSAKWTAEAQLEEGTDLEATIR
jgi:hypothetical protein